MTELIKKWVRRAGLDLVSLEGHGDDIVVTVCLPGEADLLVRLTLDAHVFADRADREAESLMAYEVEKAAERLHVDWHFRFLSRVMPAELLRRGDAHKCKRGTIGPVDQRRRVFVCTACGELPLPAIAVIPHDGMVAVLYADEVQS